MVYQPALGHCWTLNFSIGSGRSMLKRRRSKLVGVPANSLPVLLLDSRSTLRSDLQCGSASLILSSSWTMPVKWVLHWQPNAGTMVNSQILNEVSQCAESINGVKDGRWKATLTFYRPNLRDPSLQAEFPRDFMGISLLEQPNKYYFIIRGQKIILEADSSILTIMEKLQSYKSKVALNFEGVLYKLGDFQLKIGKVAPSTSESLRGIMMEVEYLPISSIEKSRQVMEEFLNIWREAVSKKSLPGQFMHMEPNYAEYGLLDNYTSQHTAVQYATALAQLIATVQQQPGQPMRN